jgi:anti-sigma regulatory factor (Ser/Thr protein kinase)
LIISGEKTFNAYLSEVSGIMDYIVGLFPDFSEKTTYDIKLACEEILVNIASYAYPDGGGQLVIKWENDTVNHKVRFKFVDSGIPFNPLLREDPDLTVPMKDKKIGGLGIMMVRKRMDSAEYEYIDGKNVLIVTKSY